MPGARIDDATLAMAAEAHRTVWRLERERYADSAFTGEGARLYGNRFNSLEARRG